MSQSLQAYVTDPTSCAIDRAPIAAPIPTPRAQKHHEKAVARCAKSTLEFTHLPPFLRWVDAHATAGAQRVWLNINPRGGLNGCPSCGCRMEGGRGRSNARLLALNALAWSIAAPRGYALLDAWPAFADAFGRESLGYDGYHYTYSLKNFREKGGGKASSRERDGAPPRCTVVGVLDFIRASRLLDEHVCPAACAPQ